MAEAKRNESELDFEMLGGNPLDLEGLEQLLEFGHVELVEPIALVNSAPTAGGALNFSPDATAGANNDVIGDGLAGAASSEIKLILDLLGQIETINELVLETGYKLHKAHDRMVDLEFQVKQQEAMAKRIEELEIEVGRIVELETWLDAVIAENDRLKRPLWKKVFNVKGK